MDLCNAAGIATGAQVQPVNVLCRQSHVRKLSVWAPTCERKWEKEQRR